MHRALFVDELARSIVSHCEDASSDCERRRTLFRLGLTCKALLGPALDALWGRLPSVSPLLKLVPDVVIRDGIYVSALSKPENPPDLRFRLLKAA
jgi:hypothetical protein